MQSWAEDMGYEVEVAVWTDSDACRGIASRRGLGKMRHVELRYLWLQEVVKAGRLAIRRIGGLHNLADHLTKVKNRNEMQKMIGAACGYLSVAEWYA